VRLLAFSDVHRDDRKARELAEMAREADVVVAAGDFASVHIGLEKLIDMLVVIETPTVLVPGNNETEEALREACQGWKAATVLHGEGTTIDGVDFYGLGAGVPPTPWDWSFDLTEEEAEAKLAGAPEGAVLVVHSPPKGHLDGRNLGSEAILRTIEEKRPKVAICGHIHEDGGKEDRIGPTRLYNVGPEGTFIDV
jgi:Icc-related predicted phosphoesterase